MKTKSNSVKKLLSIVLAVAMMTTMLLPTNVFAVVANPGTVSSDLDTKVLVIGETVEFSVSTVPNDHLGVAVKGKYEINSTTAVEKLEYYETAPGMEGWETFPSAVSGEFGPAAGFPMSELTSQFRVTFKEAGEYDVTVSIIAVDDDEVICSETDTITVLGYADYTDLENAIVLADAYDAADYTDASYQVLADAVQDAEAAILANWTSDKQDDVADLVEAINDAIAGLVALTKVEFTAVAVADTVTADYAKANKVVMVFGEPLKAGADVLSKLDVKDQVAAAAWSNDNTVYTLELKTGHTLTNGTVINFVNDDQSILTAQGKAMVDTAAIVVGNLEEAYEKVTATAMAATIVKASDKPGVAKNDKIVLVFNAPVYKAPATVTVNGLTAKAVDTAKTVYEVTLAGAETVKAGDTLEVIDENSTTITATLSGSFGTATAPVALAAFVSDEDGTGLTKGDKITVIFNTATNKTAGQTEATFTGNLAGATGVWTDSQTLEITLGDATITIKDTIDLTNLAVMDKYALAAATVNAIKLTGSFGPVFVPTVARAVISDEDGTALTKGDKIYVIFDIETNKIAGQTETDFDGVLDGAKGIWIDAKTLEITLGTTKITEADTIDLTALAIMDKYELADAEASNVKLEGSFGVAIQPAVLTATAISKSGNGAAKAGDEIRLAFNVKMREDKLSLKDISFQYGDFGNNGAEVYWEEDAACSTLVIVLGDKPTVTPGTTKITILKDLYEHTGTKSCEESNLMNITITGTFGTSVAPTLISASLVKKVPAVGPQYSDQIVLFFNVPTNGLTQNVDIMNLLSVNGKSFGLDAKGSWSNNGTIYTVTIGSNATLEDNDTIIFTNDGSLMDINNQKTATTTSAVLSGSFGTEADSVGISPSSATATIIKNSGKAGAQAGDTIMFAFNVATNGVDLTNYFIDKGVFGTNPTGGWSNNNTVYTLVLGGDNITVADDYAFKFEADAGITDAAGINVPKEVKVGTFIGSFGTEFAPVGLKPELAKAVIIKDKDNSKLGAHAGDKIILIFNVATNGKDANINLLDDKAFGESSDSFGKDAKWRWISDAEFEITLGEGAVISEKPQNDIAIISFKHHDKLKDKLETISADEIKVTEFEGSFGVAPTVDFVRAIIVKGEKNGAAKAEKDDKIVLTFSTKTNGADIASKLSAAYGADEKGMVDATGEWSNDNTVYTITLGTNPTVTDGATVTISDDMKLTGSDGGALTKNSAVLEGSFGKSVAPVVLYAVAYSDADKDYIDIIFNTATNKYDEGKQRDLFNLDTTNLFGSYATAWNDAGNILTIALGATHTVTSDYEIVIADGKVTNSDGSNSLAHDTVIKGIKGKLRKPYIKSVVASKDGEYGTLTVTFSSKTNGKEVDLSSQASALGIGATGKWDETKTVLTISLGQDAAISVSGGYFLLNGLGITNGFDDDELVGQYCITKGDLPGDTLLVTDVRAKKDGDSYYLIITFNKHTNKKAEIGAEITGNKAFGEQPKLTWKTLVNCDQAVIKLGSGNGFVNGDEVATGATVTVKGLAFANGLGKMEEVTVDEIKGSFDGKAIRLTTTEVVADGTYTKASVTVDKQDRDYTGKAVLTFVIWDKDGKFVADVNTVTVEDMTAIESIEVSSKFALTEYSKVEVYVTAEELVTYGEAVQGVTFLANTFVK